MAYVIGVDCGTSGTKTVLFDEKGTVISSVTIEYPMYQPKNGYAEHTSLSMKDAETFVKVILYPCSSTSL